MHSMVVHEEEHAIVAFVVNPRFVTMLSYDAQFCAGCNVFHITRRFYASRWN